ncbi:4Fe-4S single cluster domain-containing protein [Ruminococcus flavefaciens]|uniref:4Fe-4S single cluster domain-containing protein n=1 Tax=Ruminococcus flavefaciens TaxID=1265 RepID=A0A1H6KZG6_RUMFL|nr:radical SAM protein [Ruminococcus flavefaciens]SEH81242.1 4Fe-4S single cluster domain-containing protein [Ruminococcus flavefaciens]
MNKYLKYLDRIEFVVTMCCTGKCRHCSEGEHTTGSPHIDTDIAVKTIKDVCSRYDIRSLMTFGGEPLLYPETVAAIHKTAYEMGIPERDIITNGYFSKDKKRIEQVASMLRESHIQRVMLSVDAFHQETIPLEPVELFADTLKENGVYVEISPAWLVDRNADNPYNSVTSELIGKFAAKGFEIGNGNVIFPQGNALKYLGEYFNEGEVVSNPYEESPYDIRSLCIGCDGSALNGNLCEKDVLQLIEEYSPK